MRLMGTPQLYALGRLIREKRLALRPHQTLRHFALRCFISPTYLSFIERGNQPTPPSAKVLSTIAYELDVNVLDLLLLAGRIDAEYWKRAMESRENHPDWVPLRKTIDRNRYGEFFLDNPMRYKRIRRLIV